MGRSSQRCGPRAGGGAAVPLALPLQVRCCRRSHSPSATAHHPPRRGDAGSPGPAEPESAHGPTHQSPAFFFFCALSRFFCSLTAPHRAPPPSPRSKADHLIGFEAVEAFAASREGAVVAGGGGASAAALLRPTQEEALRRRPARPAAQARRREAGRLCRNELPPLVRRRCCWRLGTATSLPAHHHPRRHSPDEYRAELKRFADKAAATRQSGAAGGESEKQDHRCW